MHAKLLAAGFAVLCHVTHTFVKLNTVTSHLLSLFSQDNQHIRVMRGIKSFGFVLFL